MTFQNSAALIWFLPLAGVIVALYLLKMKRRDLQVPATFLWPDRVEEIRANTLFQKLRPSWLLFLQLLALLIAVGALAKPQTTQKGLAGSVTVFVVDTSASMSATDVKPSRLGEAVRQTQEAIQSAKPTDRIAIIEAGATPRVISALSSDPAKQMAALSSIQPTDAEGQIGEALRLASALVGGIDGARIVLLSDGDFEPIANFSRGKAAFVYRCIGNLDDNLSVGALGVAQTASGRQLYCGIKNNSLNPNGGTLNLYADGKLLDSIRSPKIPPTGQWGRTIAAPPGARLFEAKLDAPDFLKSDNYAVCIADPSASLHVLLVTKGDLFLERALALDPRVTLDKATEVPATESAASGVGSYDIVVFDGVPETAVKARGVLTFGKAGSASPVTEKGTVSKPRFVSSEPVPLLSSVDLASIYIDHQTSIVAKANGETVAQTSAGPVVVTAKDTGKRQIFVAFEPLESDFPLQVGFPIFVANALDYLAGGVSSTTLSVKAGQPFSLPITSEAKLTTPSGEVVTLNPTGANLVVREARSVGKYTIESEGRKRTIYATLRSERASNIRPEKDLNLGGGQVKASTSPVRFADFWRPLAVLAILVLGAEWWMFARKS
ncbi:MAG: BatA and WFA domain-containing protein [Fimbriimonas sp.]|nr:BatA and WFA domain-containing protein [Fimbriimonas sp.]